MREWGIFTSKEMLDHTINTLKKEGLEITEVREMTLREKFTYCTPDCPEMWFVGFQATVDECNKLVEEHELFSL